MNKRIGNDKACVFSGLGYLRKAVNNLLDLWSFFLWNENEDRKTCLRCFDDGIVFVEFGLCLLRNFVEQVFESL